MNRLITQFTKFGIIGGIGFVIDFGIFNLLLLTVLSPRVVHEGPIIAKIISTVVAVAWNWIGNRSWTFRDHRGKQLLREGVEFGVVSAIGLGIGVGCLWISHYVLGLTSVLADNIASNVVGLGLGTIFRFVLYRFWVFAPHSGEPAPAMFPNAHHPHPPVSDPGTSSP